ncbi:hypothetical protein Z517_08073 [Fonsecaea pedrosoi CBS 271.37]|uniref:Uncharacterized protein n=1 Tax=Fonsecaea pedrosoi CBS 271.37 TaxID=1442368 RepID=A0A0D2H0N0_9EURO|nr:uncharacterized protein Z517_08073 [Fonsecaea pedrosoi CBS 271.37]KIW78239.1 hypothetical protein Z517_08073 [Fonsecaea pedrosoi CBS 271.37]
MAYPQNTFAPSRSLSNPDISLSSFRSISGALASASPPPLPAPPKPPAPRKDLEPTSSEFHPFLCTICWTEQKSLPHTFGLDGRIVCADCWRWTYHMSICWRCGDQNLLTVSQSPLLPPPYLDCNCEPHKHGMIVEEPPVCSRCVDLPESLAKLEQHVRAPRNRPGKVIHPKGLLDGASSRLSLTDPLNPDANRLGAANQKHTMHPPWLVLQSSKRHAEFMSPYQSGPQLHQTPRQKQSTASSTPFATPPQSLKAAELSSCPNIPHQLPLDLAEQPSTPLVGTVTASWVRPGTHLSVDSSKSQGLQFSASTGSSTSPSQHLITSPSDEPRWLQTGSLSRIRRSFSTTKALNPFRRASTTKSFLPPVGSCGPTEMHTPLPSQDIAPARSPIFKELSAFFTSRSKTGKVILQRRVSPDSTKATESGSYTPDKTILDRACERCGMDLSDWWVRREESGAQSRDNEGHRDHTGRFCEDCIATGLMSRAMPGAWD